MRKGQFSSVGEAHVWACRNLAETVARLSPAETEALIYYKGYGGYRQINQALRDNRSLTDELQLRIADIDQALGLTSLPYPLTVYRGMRSKHLSREGAAVRP